MGQSFLRSGTEFPERVQERFEQLARIGQNARRIAAEETVALPALRFEGLQGDGIEVHDGLVIPKAVAENCLAVPYRIRIGLEFRQEDAPCGLQEKRIASRHDVEQGLQREVLRQERSVRKQCPLRIEIAVAKQQVRFQSFIRSFKHAYVSRYLSAMARA